MTSLTGYWRLKRKENCKLLALKSKQSRSGSTYSDPHDMETFGVLENWSLKRGGRNWRLDCY